MTAQAPSTKGIDSAASRLRLLGVLGIVIFTFALRVLWLPEPGFKVGGRVVDQGQFVQWSWLTKSPVKEEYSGLAAVYTPAGAGRRWCNYPPGYVFVLAVLAKVYDVVAPDGEALSAGTILRVFSGNRAAPALWAYAIYKLPAISADCITGVVLFLWLSARYDMRRGLTIAALYVLIPAVVHNSALWGQIDAVPTLLMIISLELARRGRILWMSALAALAVLTKAQALMLAPLWALAVVDWARRDAKRWLQVIGSVFGVAAVVLYPFRTALGGVWDAYANAAGFYPYLHLNGFSAWFLAAPLVAPLLPTMSHGYVPDSTTDFLLSPRYWGYILLVGVWIATAMCLWLASRRDRRQYERALLIAARLLPLGFFLFSTQMHERYLFPALAIWAWGYAPSRKWWTCWLLMAACVSINQLWVWPGPAEQWWTEPCKALMHAKWLGLAPGVWCSFALLGVFGVALFELLHVPVRSLTEKQKMQESRTQAG